MKLNSGIWAELGTLAKFVGLIDHETGAVRFVDGVSTADKDAVNAIISAHDPLAPAAKTAREQIAELEAQQTPRLMREALTGGQYAMTRMAAIDAQITILRS